MDVDDEGTALLLVDICGVHYIDDIVCPEDPAKRREEALNGLQANLRLDLINEFLSELVIGHGLRKTSNRMFDMLFDRTGFGLDQDLALIWPHAFIDYSLGLAAQLGSLLHDFIDIFCRRGFTE
jgi:hypothetical protein